ncbi:hypothetical protein PsorP6_013700 [Peronosclerospora sorghi]|uniref:Uncharacterized protein n=1 Tax=Peronosclerospora sorghi TaxID=230839 RepID=A0ACC0VGZ9_9STRA|nr:hypothetical protein PsorP6_013700 [Peronosclerospora sorghi]
MPLDEKLRKKLDKRDLTEVVVIGGNHTTAFISYIMDWGYRSAKMLLDEADRMSRLEYCGQIKIRRSRAPIPVQTRSAVELKVEVFASSTSSVSRVTNDENDRNAVYCVLITSEKDMRTVSVTDPFVLVNKLPVPPTYRVRSDFSSAYGSGTSDSPSEPETIAVGGLTLVSDLYSN